MIIYKITNSINNKCYIGQTINSFKRRYWGNGKWWLHSSSPYLIASVKKYGIESFKIEIIEENVLDINTLNSLEQKYIKMYNCICPNGYNFKLGGTNKKHHWLTKQKIGNAKAKTWVFKNNKTDEILEIYNLAKFCRENNLNRIMMLGVSSGHYKKHKHWSRPETILKKWTVKSPNGEIFIILEGELRSFCRKYKLQKTGILGICNGVFKQYKGWIKF